MKPCPPKRPINAKGVCYSDDFCEPDSDCENCFRLDKKGTLADLKSGERKAPWEQEDRKVGCTKDDQQRIHILGDRQLNIRNYNDGRIRNRAMNNQEEVFTIKARRCKRCGGLLTSKQAVEDGYGHVCKMKANAEAEASKPDPNQLTLFDAFASTEEQIINNDMEE